MSERDERGRWLPGQSANPGGRQAGVGQFRKRAREHGSKALDAVLAVLSDSAAKHGDRLRAAELLAEWGYGKLGSVVADDNDGQPMPDLSVFFPVRIDTADEDSTDDASGTR